MRKILFVIITMLISIDACGFRGNEFTTYTIEIKSDSCDSTVFYSALSSGQPVSNSSYTFISEEPSVASDSRLADVSDRDLAALRLGGCCGFASQGQLALKTNLLYDAALMPNLAAEYNLSCRWSVSVGGSVAWWNFPSSDRFYQMWLVNSEVKFKISPWYNIRHFLTVYGYTGQYDLKWAKTGYHSKHVYSVGLGWSYVWEFKRNSNMAMEFSFGAGYLQTLYDKYERMDGSKSHYVFTGTDRTTYIGPTKVAINLIWRINTGQKHAVR